MKKIINFLRRGTFIAAICLLFAGTLAQLQISSTDDNTYSSYALKGPDKDERPLDNPEVD